MKKILIVAASALCAVAVYVGVNAYANNSQMDLLTQNIEALTRGEKPENGTCCTNNNDTCELSEVTVHNAYLKSDGRCD